MVKQSIITLMTGLLLFLPTNGYGQEIMPIEQEREIKISGKYYFAECIDLDEAEAEECALKELTQVVIVGVLRQAITQKNEAMLKNIEIQANTARLPMDGKIKILAYIAKDSIYVQNDSVGADSIANPEKTILKTEPQTVISKKELQPVPTGENSSQSLISNPVVRDLADSNTFEQFRRKANNWRRQGKLVYGNKKTAFLSPENCHIAVFSSSGTLIALLDKGNNSRIDLLTGKSVPNPEQQYSGNEFIWIRIN